MKPEHRSIEQISQRVAELKSKHKNLLNNFRDNGLEHFASTGLPGKNDENWLYTDLSNIFETEWNLNPKAIDPNIDVSSIFTCDVPDFDTHLSLAFNGHYFETETALPIGVVVGSVATIAEKYPELIAKYLFKAADPKQAMTNLNAALATDGFFLHIPQNTRIDKPIQIVNAAHGDKPHFINQHNIIIADKNSFAQITYCDHTLSSTRFLTNNLTEIFLEKNAELDFYNIQNSHNEAREISAIYVKQKRSSKFTSNIVSLNGGLIRNYLNVSLLEEGAECNVSGLNITDKHQHVDNHTVINHLAPHCTSNQLYKGIYDENSTGAFTGRIFVDQRAQKTEAYQSNKNMLLTPNTKVNSRPQLEIYADDVKCSHGATTGQLDSNAMFYLRSRGIDKNEARMLMMYAFANEIISKIKMPPLATKIEGMVNRRLRGESSRCATCPIKC